MDYILQIEKLFKYFEFNLNLEETRILYKIKRNFNNELNLLGCFVKDYLTIKNSGNVSEDSSIYNDFVILFENLKENHSTKDIIEEFYNYSNYYLKIIFEEVENEKIEFALATINTCDALDSYPILIELFDKFYNQKIDSNYFYMMLQLIMDIVLKRFENPEQYNKDLAELIKEANVLETSSERLAV